MSRTINLTLAALALGAAAAAAQPAAAQDRHGGHFGGPHGGGAYAPHGGYRGGYQGGYRGGYYGGGYRFHGGYPGWRGYGWPYGYGWYGYAPWAWYAPAPYYGYYGWYDDYEDYAPEVDYGAEPPPPPPPAQPAPERAPPRAAAAETKSFVLYFPFDSSELTAEARHIVDDAARYSAARPGSRATIVGYTDAAGSESYNQALSERRSQVVREALQADGVAGESVDAAWRGERDQAVRTPDGAREPANRRVTIVIKSGSDRLAGGRPYASDDEVDDEEN
ncbi:OmpA family protein [Phenylobacterium montanum]|uniref:OmpA family protein n=1 Tax=Phenylobacterium montanum TaxID=2823693 RepID=A0A975G1R4_9CAUL|nr:OmpA family protein [Caulobacter sp. S6]QUD88902.1 OmpA family protein [Caulobacter sp. S6]